MIDNKTLQTFMNSHGQKLVVDGIFGPMSYTAARSVLKANSVNPDPWTNDRVYIAICQLFLNKTINTSLVVDGLSGPRTNDAIYSYNAKVLRPTKVVWPRQSEIRAGTSIFGKPGSNLGRVNCPFEMWGDYEGKIKVNSFVAHKRVASHIERVLQRTLAHYGYEKIKKLKLHIFSGCYNKRVIAGTSNLSMHAWAIAVDINAAYNMLKQTSATATLARPECAKFIDFWEEEGFISLGRARNFDWQHFQAARF